MEHFPTTGLAAVSSGISVQPSAVVSPAATFPGVAPTTGLPAHPLSIGGASLPAASDGIPPRAFDGPPAAAPADFEELPSAIVREIELLNSWQAKLEFHEKRQVLYSRLLKIPIIISTSCSGLFVYLQSPAAIVISGAIASVCVLCDGYFSTKKAFTRAIYDIRILENWIRTEWEISKFKNRHHNEVAVEVLTRIRAEKQRIATYLNNAEVSSEQINVKRHAEK